MKNKKLESWIAKNKPGENFTSCLYEHLDEINELIKLNYTQNQIVQFLNEAYSIKTSRQNLSAFIKRHKKSQHKNSKNEKTKADKNEEKNSKNKFDELDEKFGYLVD